MLTLAVFQHDAFHQGTIVEFERKFGGAVAVGMLVGHLARGGLRHQAGKSFPLGLGEVAHFLEIGHSLGQPAVDLLALEGAGKLKNLDEIFR